MIYKTLEVLKTKYGLSIHSIKIEDVRIGVFESIVRLTGGLYGLASTLIGSDSHCYRMNREPVPFSPGQICGKSIYELFDIVEDTKITMSLKIAALNALSSSVIQETGFKMIEDIDPYDLLDLSGKKNITIVGAFKTYIEKIASTHHILKILELKEEAINESYRKYFVPPTGSSNVLQESDIAIITGSSIVNGTLENLLSFIPEHCQIAITGPSCSFVPDVLFRNKVEIIGSTLLTDPEQAMQLVGEASAGFHLFKSCAKKICFVNEIIS